MNLLLRTIHNLIIVLVNKNILDKIKQFLKAPYLD